MVSISGYILNLKKCVLFKAFGDAFNVVGDFT